MPVKKRAGRPVKAKAKVDVDVFNPSFPQGKITGLPGLIVSEADISAEPEATVSAVAPQTEKLQVKWFAEIDLNQKGKPISDFPARYFDAHIEELAYDIGVLETKVSLGGYDGKALAKDRRTLDAKKKKYDAIQESRIKLTPATKDKIYRAATDLGERIREAQFTREQESRHLVDAHEEASRMSMPCIEVRSEVEADYFRQKGVHIVNGKVSRTQAEICYKTFKKELDGGSVNTESLRR